MQLMTRAIDSAKEIVSKKGKLSEKDTRSIMQMCIDLGGGELTKNASYTIKDQIGWSLGCWVY